MTRSCFLAFAFVLASSCGPKGGTDVGNGATVSYNIRGYEKAPPAGKQGITLTSGVEVDAVWISVEQFRLSRSGACGSNGENGPPDYAGPAIADLLGAGVVTPEPRHTAEGGDYCRLRVTLHAVDAAELPASAPPELAGHSVLVTGRRADGVPFMIRTTQKFQLQLDASTPFELRGPEPLIIGFDLAALAGSVDLDSFPGPSIVIDATTPSVIAKFDQALRASPSLFRDEDADGELSPAESAPGEEIAVGIGN